MARRKLDKPPPSLQDTIADVRAKLKAAIQQLDLLRPEPEPPVHWREDDADIKAAYETLHALSSYGSGLLAQADKAISLALRLVREEQDRRWAVAPAISADELERRIVEQQSRDSGYVEAFCPHCGMGYMHHHWNEVAENGLIAKDTGRCRCGRSQFIYRKHPDEPEKHGVFFVREYQPSPPKQRAASSEPPPAPDFAQRSLF